MRYYADKMRHLVCIPYTIENLHKMGEELGIGKWWLHKDHYDIPKRRMMDMIADPRIEWVSPKVILNIIKGDHND